MKNHNPLLLVLAMSTALSLAACDRDRPGEIDVVETPPAAEPAAVTPAPAAPVDSGMSFAQMDKNSDGGINRDELAETEMLYQHFSVADTDNDGKLTEAEVEQHRADMAATPGT